MKKKKNNSKKKKVWILQNQMRTEWDTEFFFLA